MKILFYICALVMVACTVFAIRAKRRNYGYILVTILLAIADLLCTQLFSCPDPNQAGKYLMGIYICHAWSLFALALLILNMTRRKAFRFFLIPVGIFSVIQTVIVAGGTSNGYVVENSFKLGRDWWIATKLPGGVLNLGTYQALMVVFAIAGSALLIYCYAKSAHQFRAKYIFLIGALIWITSVDIMTDKKQWPIWILLCVITVSIALGYYFVIEFSGARLKMMALSEFANDLSDGVVLFDELDDMVYMNDCLKYSLAMESLVLFKTRSGIEELMQQVVDVYGKQVICCKNRDDTENIYFTVKKKELGEHSDCTGNIYVFHDTTDSVLKLMSMEETNIELERATRMKADFLANMSHEIRTPMNAVIGMAEIALREEKSPNVANYLHQIVNSGHNLVNIINDILDYSKIEAGKMDIFPDTYELVSEITDVSNVLATRIGDKDLELFVKIDPRIPKLLLGDAMRIRQILINLANNAIKFTQEGIVFIDISFEKTDDETINLTYHVKDTGPGIKTEDLTKLFQNFQQVDSKRNRSVEGTGLGLAISQRLTEAMGGRIGVTSKFGVGSDFYFTIPQKIVDEAPSLVVDDAENKRALVLYDRGDMVQKFVEEIKSLGMQGGVLKSLSEYQPGDGQDFIFFEQDAYDDEVKRFLDDHPELTGAILVPFSSDFTAKQNNLRVMRRPQTSVNMVSVLNDREVVTREDKSTFTIDFTAEDAHILIVDDNAINVTIAEGLLKPIKAQCVGALSGEDALKKLKKKSFDLVLMDHMMPEMDGVEATKLIRAEVPGGADIPVIALTANVLEGMKEMFLKEGMNDFVAKPVDIKDLITKVKKWLPADKIKESEGEVIEEETTESSISFQGLDNEAAIRGLGSPELFAEIVEEYYRTGEKRMQDIRSAYDEEDWKSYTIRVHALKSASKQIGAMELGSMAEALEKAGNAEDLDYIREKTEPALEEYSALLSKLAPYFPAEEKQTGTRGEIAEEERDSLLDAILEACENLDMDTAAEKQAELAAYMFPEEQAEMVRELAEAIENYDVDQCREMAEKIRHFS